MSQSFSSLMGAYLQPLLAGDRATCRELIEEAVGDGATPADLLNRLIWPVMESLQVMFRDDQITATQLSMATRLNRALADQISAKLDRKPSNHRKALIFCGANEPEELGGQICADLFEAEGWTVKFGGGGVPDDEILQLIGEFRPHLLVMFATLPAGVPQVRKLIDYLREVNSCPDMQVMCCGGIYKRAEGLSDEIGADLYAPDAREAVEVATANPTRRATVEQQTVGRMRRIRKAQQRKTTHQRPTRQGPQRGNAEAA
jgi:methanogenic corrinoid protein MtbC1